MNLFITGATGFVGSHIARVAALQGANLRLLARKTSNLSQIEGLDADLITGDLAQPNSYAHALRGCDALIHVAADYRLWVRDPQQMYAANVQGTADILQAARKAGVPRVVYTSSVATMKFDEQGTPAAEDTPASEAGMIGHYKRSKFLAEQQAIQATQRGQNVIILNPTTPVGAGDIKPTPTGRIIVDFLNRKFPAYVDTGLNLVDVDIVAETHLAALTQGQSGRRYILGGENLTLKQILDRLSGITGLPSPTMRVPHAVAEVFAYFDEFVTGKLRGKEPRATVEAVRMGRKKMFASSDRAIAELGYRIVPVDNALHDAVEWFRGQGYAPPA